MVTRKRSRPTMKDYGIHTGDEGLMDWSWVDEQMAKSRNYWICTVRPDGKPHVAPVWGVWVDEALYFGSGRSSRKSRNLTASPNVVVHLESGDDTVIIEGTVSEVGEADIPLLIKIADAYAEKYPPFKPDPKPTPGNVTYRLNPEIVYAWLESDFPKTATRWVIEES